MAPTDTEVDAFLEKEIFNNHGVVTYRLLSRKLVIHVNAAKNALASFYSQRRERGVPVYATFWLSGEPQGRTIHASDDSMEVDDVDEQFWLSRRVLIVGEEDLEDTKASFSVVHSLHVYSLSSTPSTTSQLCGPSRAVRDADRTADLGSVHSLGKLTSQQVKRGAANGKLKGASSALKVQARPPATANGTLKQEKQEHTKEKPSQSKSTAGGNKPMATGKLTWTKANSKDEKTSTGTSKSAPAAEKVKKEHPVDKSHKSGLKRKSDAISDQPVKDGAIETERLNFSMKADPEPTHVRQTIKETVPGAARVKKGVVLSEDEDEDFSAKGRTLGKENVRVNGDSDKQSVRAMMDIDDSDVIKVPRPSNHAIRQEEEEEEEEPPATDHADSAMDDESDDPAPKVKARKRRQRKEVPVGRNGLKKRRIVKSKTDFDEKGYIVTVDYSSYESVDEEEEEEITDERKTKLKSTTVNKTASAKKRGDARVHVDRQIVNSTASKNASREKPAAKSKGLQSGGSQRSLANFFAPGGGKT